MLTHAVASRNRKGNCNADQFECERSEHCSQQAIVNKILQHAVIMFTWHADCHPSQTTEHSGQEEKEHQNWVILHVFSENISMRINIHHSLSFLTSQDVLEVMGVTHSLTHSLSH